MYVPAAMLALCATWLPLSCKNATCTPSGAGGLPLVKPLPLPLMPAPVKTQLAPAGAY